MQRRRSVIASTSSDVVRVEADAWRSIDCGTLLHRFLRVSKETLDLAAGCLA